MTVKNASPELELFLETEYAANHNATLRDVHDRLQALCDSATDERRKEAQNLLSETNQLIQTHEEHCQVRDFLFGGSDTRGGAGTHG